MQHNINLAAGVKTSVGLQGSYLVMYDMGASGVLEVAVFAGNEELERITEAARGMSLEGTRFDKIELTAANDCTVKLIVSDGRIRMGTSDGANVNATIIGQPIDVVNDRGAPANPVYVSGITYSDAPATSNTNAAPVACSPVIASVAAADATCKSLRLCNLGPDPVAIGAAGLTWANRAVVLDVGDVWLEDRGANLAWYAITDAAKSANVTVQRVKS